MNLLESRLALVLWSLGLVCLLAARVWGQEADHDGRAIRPEQDAVASKGKGDELGAGKQATLWAVQVHAFSREINARNAADRLKAEGYGNAYVVPTDFKERTWYRVLVGPMATRKEAGELQEELKKKGKYADAWIVEAGVGVTKPDPTAKPPLPGLGYRVAERKRVDHGDSRSMAIKVFLNVSAVPTEDATRRLAEEIWRDDNQGWDQLTVWIYLPDMEIDGSAFAVAVFRRTGLDYFNVTHAALWRTRWQQ